MAESHLIDGLLARYGLHDDDRGPMAALLNQCIDDRLADEAWLCHQGAAPDGLYLLLQGALAVHKRDARNEYRRLAVATAPGVLGHMGLVTRNQRTAALRAEGPARVARLPKASFDALMEHEGGAGDLCRRLVLAAMLDQFERATVDVQRMLQEAEGASGPGALPYW